MRRLTHAAPVDPPALDELVALPRLAAGQADQQREQDAEEESVAVHAWLRSDSRCTTASHRPRARSTSSMNSRTAPRPPGCRLTQCDARPHFGRRVGRRRREAHARQHRQVDQVVAHVGHLCVASDPRSARISSIGRTLVGPPCDHELDAQFGRPARRRPRTRRPLSKPDLQALPPRPDQRRAVADGERLDLRPSLPIVDACRRSARRRRRTAAGAARRARFASAVV